MNLRTEKAFSFDAWSILRYFLREPRSLLLSTNTPNAAAAAAAAAALSDIRERERRAQHSADFR